MPKNFRILTKNGIQESEVPGKYAGYRPGKIFGRLDCKSGMRMKKENRVFFQGWDDAVACGYRPCKKCRPTPEDSQSSGVFVCKRNKNKGGPAMAGPPLFKTFFSIPFLPSRPFPASAAFLSFLPVLPQLPHRL